MVLIKQLRASAGIALLVGLPAVAFGQQATPAPASAGLEEIVVTAERKRENLQTTPVAVTSFNATALAQKGATTALDLGTLTPGLEVSSRATTGSAQGGFTIRGMGVDATGSSPAVGIYIDEVYYPSGTANLLGFFDVADVEVLRGPQGTLFGRNTIAGAVLYNSVKPSQDYTGFASGTLGSYGHDEVGGAVNVPLNSTLALRVSARYDRLGGFVHDDLTGTDRGEDRTEQARVQLRWTPIDTVTVDLKLEGFEEKTNGRAIAVTAVFPNAQFPALASLPAAFLPPGFGALRPNQNLTPLTSAYISPKDYTFAGFNSPDSLDDSFHTAQANIAWDLTNDIRLKSITAYSISKNQVLNDLDNTPISIINVTHGHETLSLFTQEVQLAGKSFADRLSWTVGAYYYNSSDKVFGQNSYFGPNNVADPQNGGDIETDNEAEAGYAEATYKITDAISAALGLRFSHEEVTAKYLDTVVPGPFAGPPFGAAPVTFPTPLFAPQMASFNNLSPHIGINYELAPDAFFYAKASRGFRAGGFTVGSLIPSGALAYAPEKAWTYEAGARLQFLDNRLRINPTIFRTDWDQIQFNTFIYGAAGIAVVTENAGDAQIQGSELEAQFAATKQLLLTGSAAYLEGQYTRVAPTIALNVGDPLQHSPKWKFTLGARYTMDLPGDTTMVSSIDYSWIDKQRSAVSNADFITQPSYGLLNARFEFVPYGGAFTVAVYGTNLTDQYYYIGGIDGSTSFGTTEADLGRRREVGINVRYDF